MTAQTHASTTTPLALVFQLVGALAMVALAIVAALFFVKFATMMITYVLPVLVVGAALYVLMRLMVDAGREVAE